MSWTCAACATQNDLGAPSCVVCGTPHSIDPTLPAVPVAPVIRSAALSAPSTSAGGANLPPASATPPGPPAPGSGATAERGGVPPWVIAAAIVVVVLGIGAAVLVATSGGGSSDATTPEEPIDFEIVDDAAAGSDVVTTTTTLSATTITSTPPIVSLQPVGATASAERPSVDYSCGQGYTDYVAENLIDGDSFTGWGASRDDGTGAWIRIDFGRPVHLRQVGLTPGFTKYGMREDRGCSFTDAFPLNRFVPQVSYEFDDGSVQLQQFERRGDLQFTDVDVVTSSVKITLLDTELQPGSDTDTVLSEAEFRGWMP